MELAVERLISALDASDLYDEDPEDGHPTEDSGGREPFIGNLGMDAGNQARLGADDNREDEHDGTVLCDGER